MSEATYDALESEAYEGEGEGYGDAYEGEAYGEAGWEAYGENARSRADRRARQRQIMLARQRQLQTRNRPQPLRPAPQPPGSRPSPATINAIRAVDLDSKVAQDSLRRQLDRAKSNTQKANIAAAATAAAGQILDSYEANLKEHALVRAFVRALPLGILPGDPDRKGVGAVVLHPAFIGGALVGGIFLVGKLTTTAQGVHDIRLAVPATVPVDTEGTLVAVPVDRNGHTVSGVAVTWTSTESRTLQILDSSRGTFKAVSAGQVVVTATADDVTAAASVTVESP